MRMQMLIVGAIVLAFLFGGCRRTPQPTERQESLTYNKSEHAATWQKPERTGTAPPTCEVGVETETIDPPTPPQTSTVIDLVEKGFPVMSNPRKLAYTQTAAQSIPEVIVDLGNMLALDLTNLYDNTLAPPSDIRYFLRATCSMKALRVIEEGRKNPDMVAQLLRDEIISCLTDFDEKHRACHEARVTNPEFGGWSWGDEYYNQHHEYKHPIPEFLRVYDVMYSSFYILANIDRLDSDLLADLMQKKTCEKHYCMDMEVWLIDCYFRQAAEQSEAAAKHANLTQGFEISGRTITRSEWDAIWEVGEWLLAARNVNLSDIETIEVLRIPYRLALPDETKRSIMQNFLEHAKRFQESTSK